MFNTTLLSEQVEKALKDEILSGRLAPEQRINLRGQASNWNVSPTPVRDAVKRLEAQGLVNVSPRRGVFVSKVDRKALKDIFDIRIALECMVVELATPTIPMTEAEEVLGLYRHAEGVRSKKERDRLLSKIDLLIHTVLLKRCGNTRLIAIMDDIQDLVSWSQRTVIAHLREAREAGLSEHIRIAEAVCARDIAGAVVAMREHLANSLNRIDAHLSSAGKSSSTGGAVKTK